MSDTNESDDIHALTKRLVVVIHAAVPEATLGRNGTRRAFLSTGATLSRSTTRPLADRSA